MDELTNETCSEKERPIPPSVERARVWVDENFRANPSLAEVAAVSKISRFYFHRLFKRLTGQTLKQYIDGLRMEDARRMLLDGVPSTEIAKRLGFSSKSHFTSRFREQFGAPPARWVVACRKGDLAGFVKRVSERVPVLL